MALPSVLENVRSHALRRGDDTAFVFMRRHDDPGERISWCDLWHRARKLAAALPEFQDPQHAGVLVFCNDEKNFVTALLAVWLRGAVAIPATGGLNAHLVARNQHIIQSGRPDLLLHDLPYDKADALAFGQSQMTTMHIDAEDDLTPVSGQNLPQSGGLLQFTSGSTSLPKAVLLDMQTLSADCAAIQNSYALDRETVGVHWLPLFHDMGLIGSVIEPYWSGAVSVILRPSIFIQRPIVWLRTISEWRATITSAPNFAYARAIQDIADHDLIDLDLSSLKNVIFGGEPVAKDTVEAVFSKWGPIGLRPDAIAPSYGMAEVGLLVSSGKRLDGPIFETRQSGVPIANLGPVVDGLSFVARDPKTQKPCAEGQLGAIWLTGENIGRVVHPGGNWREDAPKAAIDTGDFGFVLNGEIYVTGRNANKIIVRGRNIFAEDVEALVQSTQTSGLFSGIAAIGLIKDGTQALCILVELADRHSEIDIVNLNQSVVGTLGVKPADIVVLRRASLPRTSSGKIQHIAAREAFLAGALDKRVISHVIQTNH